MANPNEDCESHAHTQLRNQFVITRCWAGWLIHLMQMVFSCSLIHIKPALPITKSSFTLSVFECDWWQYGKFAFCEIRYGFECKWESCTAAGVCVCCAAAGAAAGAAASAWNNTLEWVFNYIVRTLRMIWFECVCVFCIRWLAENVMRPWWIISLIALMLTSDAFECKWIFSSYV